MSQYMYAVVDTIDTTQNIISYHNHCFFLVCNET